MIEKSSKTSYLTAYIVVCICMLLEVIGFLAMPDFSIVKLARKSGLSQALDLLILPFFVLGYPLWGILRFKSWAAAGVVLYLFYCDIFPVNWFWFAQFVLVGLMTIKMTPLPTMLIGIASVVVAVIVNFSIL